MKIGIVLPSNPAYSETFFINKIKGLESYGFQVILFVNSFDNTNNQFNTKVAPDLSKSKIIIIFKSIYYLLKSIIFHFSATKKLVQLDSKDKKTFSKKLTTIINNSHILAEKVDWLHFGFGTMALGRENLAKAIGAKMALSFRGFDIGIYPLKKPNCYKLLWQKVDKIHIISDDIKKMVVDNGFENISKIVKITPAINFKNFKSEKKIHNQIFQTATIARLHWKKGLEYTLEALSILKKNGIKFHYTIIGDGPEKERLQFATYQLDLVNEVTFTGKITPNEVKNIVEKSDLYLQYSIQEGFCNAVLEAQAMKKLCIVSDAEGLTENIINNVTGFVIPKRNPLSLAQKIEEVLKMSENDKNKITQQACERVKAEFNLEKQAKEFIEFYEEKN